MELKSTLFALERELGEGDGATYRRHLTDDAIVVVPGQAMSREQTAQAMDASPGWDALSFEDESLVVLGRDTALLSYRFHGTRGEDFTYAALMSSVYVERDGAWKMAFHQQTPLQT